MVYPSLPSHYLRPSLPPFPPPLPQPTGTQNAPSQLLTSGVGEGGRSFPSSGGSSSGLTFTTWLLISKYSGGDHASFLSLLTLSQTLAVSDSQVRHFPILRIFLNLSDQTLCVNTQLPQDDTLSSEEVSRSIRGETVFGCKQPFLAQSWNHVAVVIQKPALKGKAKATVFINGQSVGTQKVRLLVYVMKRSVRTFRSRSQEIYGLYVQSISMYTYGIHKP